MQKFGLLGHNISYSLSPAMHNAALKHLKMDDEYAIFDLDEQAADTFLNGLLRSGMQGLNVTVPYKVKAYQFVKKFGTINKEAERFGAINTVAIRQGSICGYNTDASGFELALKTDLDFNPRMKRIILFGAGGAGATCAIKLARVSEKIYMREIDQEKGKLFQERFLRYFGTEKLVMVGDKPGELKKAVQDSHLLVNATPFGRGDDEMLVPPEYFHDDLCVYDLIYKPAETPLVRAARERGLKVSTGLSMLLYQGVNAFELWTARKAPVRVMKHALEKAMEGAE